MADLWTLCKHCQKPVTVTPVAADPPYAAEGWEYECGSCSEYVVCDDVFPDLDINQPVPPPPDPLVMLAAIVGAVVERAGREAVGVALGFIAAPVKADGVPWIVCEGCLAIVDLTPNPDDDRAPMIAADGSWTCRCPACGLFNSGARLPTAPEIRARLEAVTAPILARLAVEPLPLGATS